MEALSGGSAVGLGQQFDACSVADLDGSLALVRDGREGVVVQFSKVLRHEGLSFCPRGWHFFLKKKQKLNLMCDNVAFENCLDYFL